MSKPYPKEFRENVVRVARTVSPASRWSRSPPTSGSTRSRCRSGCAAPRPMRAPGPRRRRLSLPRCARPANGSGCWSRRTWRQNDVLASPRVGRRRCPSKGAGDLPGAQSGPPALLPLAGPAGHRCRLAEVYRADALLDAHRDDPEFGHRFLRDEGRTAGEPNSAAERTAWRICRDNRWWSVFGKRRGLGKNAKARPLVHDDRVRRKFSADGPNRLWLTDITEHVTGKGELYLCAWSRTCTPAVSWAILSTLGYSSASQWPRCSLPSPAAARLRVASCIPTEDRNSGPGRSLPYCPGMAWPARWSGSGPGDNAAMESFFVLLQKNVLDRQVWATRQELRIAIVT